MPDEDIPRIKIGDRVVYNKTLLDEWIKEGCPKHFLSNRINQAKQSEKKSEATKKKKYHFSFKKPLEPLATDLAKKGYLTPENVKPFVDSFSLVI